MLAFSLADFISENDPCTPGSPNYNPSDEICALTSGSGSASGEIDFDPDVLTRTCANGYKLQNGVCVPVKSDVEAGSVDATLPEICRTWLAVKADVTGGSVPATVPEAGIPTMVNPRPAVSSVHPLGILATVLFQCAIMPASTDPPAAHDRLPEPSVWRNVLADPSAAGHL